MKINVNKMTSDELQKYVESLKIQIKEKQQKENSKIRANINSLYSYVGEFIVKNNKDVFTSDLLLNKLKKDEIFSILQNYKLVKSQVNNFTYNTYTDIKDDNPIT